LAFLTASTIKMKLAFFAVLIAVWKNQEQHKAISAAEELVERYIVDVEPASE